MARPGLQLLVFLLLGLLTTSLAARHRPHQSREDEPEGRGGRGRQEHEQGYPDIELGRAQDLLQSDGGRLRVWSEDIDAIRNSHVGVAELELEENGLLVPQYSDADKIAYVIQGRGLMGAVKPGSQSEFSRTFIRRVECGDVVALPKGTVYWWYNDGNERHRVFCAGDTNMGANPGRFHQFGLAGSKQARFGSVLHGFSRDTLATAWGVDKETIQSLLERQNDAGIVKTKRKLQFPELPKERRSREEEREERRRGEEERRRRREEDEEQNTFARDRPADSFYFEELKYSIKDERPDFYVENGGIVNKVNFHKLPALRQVGFSALRVALQKNAMSAPCFVRNAHQLLYVTRGSGRVQVASGDGKNIFDQEVREGTVLTIPQFFPSVKIAGEQGLEFISLLTHDNPSIAFLAGKNSVYRGIPKQVMAGAFNVDEDQLRELGRDEEIIFPASSRRGRRDERGGVWGENENASGKGGSEEQRRREEEQRRRREEEEQRRRRHEDEERQRREEQQERRRHRGGEGEQEKRGREEEMRREREREEEERRKQQPELPSWVLASVL